MSIDRRSLIVSGLGAALGGVGLAGCADEGPVRPMPAISADTGDGRNTPPPNPYQSGPYQPGPYQSSPYPPGPDRADTYSRDEIVHNVSDFFGVAAESVGGVIERVFGDNGLPTGYIAGTEGSGAVGLGLRYGKGLLYMKRRPPTQIHWRGPSVGWDLGGNASRVFTLCYNLQYPEAMLQRFPGVDGSIYVVAGLGVNYQRANDITLAPIRSGVGLRAGANVGYLAYSRDAHIWPF